MTDGNNAALGSTRWAIAEGYIPGWSNGPEPELQSHETCCILNAGGADAHISLMLYFEDRDPQGPYRFTVPAQRSCHKRFNDLQDPAPVPRGVGFSCVIDSDVPVVVQHTRLDSRQAENSIMTTIAYPL
ncbi:sensory rhodopsin transducer [Stenotrophomonas sp. ZAC14D2_NAIMI4_7]|uniref:sensory rhodopsin transducer n=1 Tax=Stenotrophomonas sp. ZAC14D2_NAIMI4_7 TaxID=2072405 RepID=UPI000D53FD31|nr:sensory rhodopsin transducer [Stenotrophomonas sp. ZAC14D2_NAIMI4_7]AWH17666.1 sensory rhodopsin transducer [Stenotrophomonas sp. ZAC14D2_NAIMI4_7]